MRYPSFHMELLYNYGIVYLCLSDFTLATLLHEAPHPKSIYDSIVAYL